MACGLGRDGWGGWGGNDGETTQKPTGNFVRALWKSHDDKRAMPRFRLTKGNNILTITYRKLLLAHEAL